MKKEKLCPKCGKAMHSFWCLHCGYMVNGKVITKQEKNPSASDLEIYLGERFQSVCYNENTLLIFFIGPFYFCLNRFVLLGVLCAGLDLIVYLFMLQWLGTFKFLLFFVLVRIIYMTVSNMVYMKLLTKRIEKIKHNNPDNYLDILRANNDKTMNLGDLIAGAFIFLCISIVIFLIRNPQMFK